MRFPPFAAILACVIFPMFTLAQPATQPSREGRGPGGGGGRMGIERLQQIIDNELDLSDAQRDKIRGILEDARAEMRELMPQLRDLEPQERQDRLREFMKEVHDKMSAELDENQKKTFDEKLQQMRPGMDQRQGGGQGGGLMMLERFEGAIKNLELSEDQKPKVETLLADARKKFQGLREKVQNGADPQEVREEGRQMLMDVREKLMGILTPEQQEKLRETLRPGGGPNGAGPGGDRQRQRERRNQDPPTTKPADAPKENSGRVEATPPPDTPQLAQAGQSAPDFTLQKLDGKSVQLSSFKNRVVVLIFGSATSPSFRDKAGKIEELYRSLGSKATFFVIYTKEAHAKDDWEVDRNKDSQVQIEQPKTLAERTNLAKQTREGLGLTIPFVVDVMENTTLTNYAAQQNTAIVVGKDGVIKTRQNWCDPYRLRPAIEQALKP